MTPMSRAELLALPPSVDLVTAGRAIGCIGRTKAFSLAAAGEFPVPVIKIGRRYVVPTEPILAALGIQRPTPMNSEDPAATAESIATTTPLRGAHHDGTERFPRSA